MAKDPLNQKVNRMTPRPNDVSKEDELILRCCATMMEACFDTAPDHIKPSLMVSLILTIAGHCSDPEGFWTMIRETMDRTIQTLMAMKEAQQETRQ